MIAAKSESFQAKRMNDTADFTSGSPKQLEWISVWRKRFVRQQLFRRRGVDGQVRSRIFLSLVVRLGLTTLLREPCCLS